MEWKKGLLQGLKAYKTIVFPLGHIAEVFPSILSDIFKMFLVKGSLGTTHPIGYSWNKLKEFEINMGIIIYKEEFDYLDNVVLQFLKSYSYIVPPYQFSIEFPQKEIEKYEIICNEFKGLEWDAIIDTFLDATYNLFKTGKMFNNKIG